VVLERYTRPARANLTRSSDIAANWFRRARRWLRRFSRNLDRAPRLARVRTSTSSRVALGNPPVLSRVL